MKLPLCAAVAVLMLALGAEAAPRRVGVIPLQTGGDATLAPYAIGTQDALISALGKTDAIVIDRTRTQELLRETGFQQSALVKPDTQVQLGKQLGVEVLYTGSLQRSGEQVRILISRLDVATGESKVVAQVTGKLEQIFALQDQLAMQVTGVKLSGDGGTRNGEAYRLFLAGNAAMDARTYPQAIQQLTQAIALDPNYVQAYTNRANAYVEMGQAALALADYDKAIDLLPSQALPFYNKARLLERLGQADAAVQHYTWTIARNPRLPEAYINRGNLYYNAKMYEQAQADQEMALTLNPRSLEAHINLANVYEARFRRKQAFETLTAALKLYPQSAMAWYNRANLYSNDGEIEKAYADYSAAIQADPTLAAAWHNRGRTQGILGRWEAAVADYTEALRLNPQLGVSYFMRANALKVLGRCEEANADYARACRLQVKMSGVCQSACP